MGVRAIELCLMEWAADLVVEDALRLFHKRAVCSELIRITVEDLSRSLET